MASINGGRIEYTVGYRVDQQSLTTLQQTLAKIKSMTTQDFLKLNPQIDTRVATTKLKDLQLSAKAVEKAISAAYNPKLNTTNLSKLNKELSSLNISKIYKDLNMLGTEGNKAFQGFAASAMAANTTLSKTPTIVDKIGDTLKRTLTWNLASSVINQLTGKFSEAYGYIKNLDSSLNDIRIVTGKSAEEMDKFAERANKASKALGQSTTDYTRASLIYYQQGLSDEETAARTDVTLKAANVTQQSTAEVSEQLTAVWNGYKVSAQEAELYVDKLAAVAAETASDLEELSTGMSKVASAANLVGMDVDQMNAALATTISVTRQAPETVGTAYKTILARMTTISAGGTDEDGATLTSYTEDMNTFGINVLDATGHLRDMGDVIEEVGTKWSTMSRESQIALAQVMAGQRQYNNLTALFDNWDMYLDALETSKTAAGTLEEQQTVYMQSVAAHLQQLQTASEGVMDSILDSKTIITFVDLLASAAEKIEIITDSVGNLKGVVSGLAALILGVYSKGVGSYLATSIQNIQKMREEANMLKADMANVKLFAQSEGMNDVATASLVDNVSKLQQYYRVAQEGEINQGKELAKNIAMLESELSLHKQNAEAQKSYLMSLNMTKSQSSAINRLDFGDNTINSAGSAAAEKLLNKLNERVEIAQTELSKDTTANVEALTSSYYKLAEAEAEVAKQKQNLAGIAQNTEEYAAAAEKLKSAEDKVAAASKKISETLDGEKAKVISVSSAYQSLIKASEGSTSTNKRAQAAKKTFIKSVEQEIASLAKVRDSYAENTTEYTKYQKVIEKVQALLADPKNKDSNGNFKIQPIRDMVAALNEAEEALKNTSNSSKDLSAALSGNLGEAGERIKASLALAKNEFDNLLSSLNTKAIGESIAALGSGISSIAFAGSTLHSMQETWADDTLTTTERISRLTTSLGMLLTQIPLVVTNIRKFGSGIKAVKTSVEQFSLNYALNTVAVKTNTRAQTESAKAVQIQAATAELAAKKKGLENAQIEYNTLAQKANLTEENKVRLATLKTTIADQTAAVAKAEHTVATVALGTALKAALIPMLKYVAIVAAIGAAVVGVIAIYKAYVAEQMKVQKAYEDAQATLKENQELYSKLSGEVSNLTSLLDELKTRKEALKGLTKGTDEWNEALEKVKETTETLLEQFPELQKYAHYENGQWVINEADIEKVKGEKETEQKNTQAAVAASNIQTNNAAIDVQAQQIARLLNLKANSWEELSKIMNGMDAEGLAKQLQIIENTFDENTRFDNLAYLFDPNKGAFSTAWAGGQSQSDLNADKTITVGFSDVKEGILKAIELLEAVDENTKLNAEYSKVIIENTPKSEEEKTQIESQYGEAASDVSKAYFAYAQAVSAPKAEEIYKERTEEVESYRQLSDEQKREAKDFYQQILERTGYTNVKFDGNKLTYTNDQGETVTKDRTDWQSKAYNEWLQEQQVEAIKEAYNEVNFEDFRSGYDDEKTFQGVTDFINLINNPNLVNTYSEKQIEGIKNLNEETQNQIIAIFKDKIKDLDIDQLLSDLYGASSKRADETLTSTTEKSAWRAVQGLEGFNDISQEEQQALLDKIHDIYVRGGDEGVADFEKEIKDKPIEFAIDFNYENGYKGLSSDLAKRLKTLKIDQSTFNNYKAAFKAANDEIADETVVRWLEAQKDMDKIEKNKDDIFKSLSNISPDLGPTASQLENIIQLEDAFEKLSGLDLSQDWILQHLDILKAYISEEPNAEEALNREFDMLRAANDETFNLFEKYKNVTANQTMEEDLAASLAEMFEGDKDKQDKLAATYGWRWDESQGAYIRDYTLITRGALVTKFSESNQSKLTQADMDTILGLVDTNIEKINETIQKYDPEAVYDEANKEWHLKAITVDQLMSYIINEEEIGKSEWTPANGDDSGKTTTEKTYTKIERKTDFDINYDSWDKMITYKEKELDRLEKAAENLTGEALLKNLEERKKLYDEINKQREEELKQNEKDIDKYKAEVEALGAIIDPETGYILNERDLQKGWSDSQNAIANQYNQYINDDGSLTEARKGLDDNKLNEIKKSYDNLSKSVSENQQALENYNNALEKNIEIQEDNLETLKSIAETEATAQVLKVTNAYDEYSVTAAAAAEETEKFNNLLSDDKAVQDRVEDLAKLSAIQKKELSAYEEQLKANQKAREDLQKTLENNNIKISLTGNQAIDEEAIKKETSALQEQITETQKKIEESSGAEKANLEETLRILLLKQTLLSQIGEKWATLADEAENLKKEILSLNDALSTSTEEMNELADWKTGNVDKQLETVERSLSRLQSQESRLKGNNLIANLNKQKALIQQEIKLEQNKLKIYKDQLKVLQDQLKATLQKLLVEQKVSIKLSFEKDGSVDTTSLWNSLNANKDKITDDIRETIASLVGDINSMTSNINSLEDSIFGHEEDLKDLAKKVKDAAKEAMDKALEIFNAKVDFEVNIEDAWRQFDRLEAKVDGLREKTTELFKNALLDYSDAIRYVTANINSYFGDAGGGSIQILTQHVNDIMNEIGIMQAGGTSSLYGIDQTTAFSDLENYYNQLMQAVEGFYNAIDAAKQKYSEAIDAIINKNKELLDDFEKVKSLQEHGINITKLLYGDESYEKIQEYYDAQSDIIQRQLAASVQQRDYYAQLLATMNPDDDNYDKVKQAYLDAMDAVYSYTEAKLEALHEALMNRIDAQKAAIEDSLAAAAGFGSNGQMNRDWEYQTQLDEAYLDATNTQYEIEKLTRKFNDAIAGTDSLAAKEKLTDVMNEQLDILNEQLAKGQKLTEYDIERANKVYELTLKQIALEEAQENKSKMRLRRDSQGNYRYEYIADQDKINQAKQDLADAENDLYNFDKNRAKEMVNSLNSLISEYYDKQKEITEDLELTEEERDAALRELQERYWGEQGLITMAKEEYLQASERTREESVDNYAGFDQTLAEALTKTWEETTQTVADNTEDLISRCHEYSEAVRETMDTTTSGAGDLEEAIRSDTDAMAGLIEQDEELLNQYDQQIEAIQDLLVQLEALEAQYKSVMEAALAAVEAALKLRQTSWETEEDKASEEEASNTGNNGGGNAGAAGNTGKGNRYATVFVSDMGKGDMITADPAYGSTQSARNDLYEAVKQQVNPNAVGILWESWSNEEAEKKGYRKWKRAVKYDTGGYTGEWGSDGRMAILHEKELILNKSDTANILQAVDIVRTFSSDLAALQSAMNRTSLNNIPSNTTGSSALEQNVKIEANFPNVTNANEIEAAFNNLINMASQRVMRK